MLPILLALAISWGSYADAQHKIPSDNFTAYHAPVYMYGTAFTPSTWYSIKWADGSGQVVLTHVNKSKGNGSLDSVYVITDLDIAGTWYVRVYDMSAVLVAEDSFYVDPSAVPEFPTVLAGLVVAAICCLIYWRIRRKHEEVLDYNCMEIT